MPEVPAVMKTDWPNDQALLAFMSQVEGVRKTPYADTRGYTSIGIGRNLSTRGITAEEVGHLYRNDVAAVCDTMDTAIPWWRRLSADAQRAMVSLCFMGWPTFSAFHKFLSAMEHLATPPATPDATYSDYWIGQAKAELRASDWWSETGQRGPLTIALIHA